jgi:hypothetical protein
MPSTTGGTRSCGGSAVALTFCTTEQTMLSVGVRLPWTVL